MPAHETKYCERCNAAFECKPGNITECQCFGIVLSDAVKSILLPAMKIVFAGSVCWK